MWTKMIWLGLAGALGTLARYGLAGLVQRSAGGGFPWATVTVNVAGCFAAGAFWAFAEDRTNVGGQLRTIVLVGFMGGFTTFSTLMLETGHLFRDGEWLWGAGNLLLQNGLGIVALFCGLAAGRTI